MREAGPVRKRVPFAALVLGVCSLGVAACGSSSNSTTTAAPASSSETAPVTTEAPATPTEAASTGAAATAAAGDPAAGKAVFTSTCGGCHTLKDAGTTGAVGPNLDDLKPDAARVQHQVEVGGGPMPAFKGTLSDAEIANVAAYVSSAAGT
jgi:sulfite dehydrogenase